MALITIFLATLFLYNLWFTTYRTADGPILFTAAGKRAGERYAV